MDTQRLTTIGRHLMQAKRMSLQVGSNSWLHGRRLLTQSLKCSVISISEEALQVQVRWT